MAMLRCQDGLFAKMAILALKLAPLLLNFSSSQL
jgi:hypothetical protein